MKTLRAPLLAAALSLASLIGCAVGDDPVGTDATGETSAEATVRPRFDLWRDAAGEYRFDLNAATGETLLTSEGYSTRLAALNGVLSVLENGRYVGLYRLQTTTEGQPYFELLAANHAVIATSGTFASALERGDAVRATVGAVDAYVEHWEDGTGRRFHVFAGASGQFRFNLHAGNGEIVLTSEAYSSQAAALNGAFSVSSFGVDRARYQVLRAADGRYYLNLTASNGQVIATSGRYASKANAERARDAIIALLPTVAIL